MHKLESFGLSITFPAPVCALKCAHPIRNLGADGNAHSAMGETTPLT